MKKYLIILTAVLWICSIISCSTKKNEDIPATAEAHHEDEHESPSETTLTAVQIKNTGIETGVIMEKQLTASLKTNGVLRVPNQNRATVNSVYSGIIKSLLIEPGNVVKKGQVIATIVNPEFIHVQDEYLSISSKMIMAEQEYQRQKQLTAGNAGALKNLQAAETELRTLTGRKSSLHQQIQLMGINPVSLSNGKLATVLSLRSPINGIVSNVLVKIGSYVDFSTVVAEIVDNSRLHLDLYVYEKDMPKLKDKQLIHFTLTNNPGKEYDAQIFSLGSSFEGSSKAVTVHAKVEGDKTGLIDGMNITAVISLEKATVPALPTEAIVTITGQDYIFMVEDAAGSGQEHDKDDAANTKKTDKDKEHANHSEENETTFVKIPVARGATDVGYTEITLLKQIPKEAKVVVKGAFFVQAKMTNTGEHEH